MEEFEKMAASELEETEISGPETPGSEAAAEFNPDLSTEANGNGANENGTNHEADTAAQYPQAASNASASDAE